MSWIGECLELPAAPLKLPPSALAGSKSEEDAATPESQQKDFRYHSTRLCRLLKRMASDALPSFLCYRWARSPFRLVVPRNSLPRLLSRMKSVYRMLACFPEAFLLARGQSGWQGASRASVGGELPMELIGLNRVGVDYGN